MATFKQKLSISIKSAALFALVNLPQLQEFADDLLPLNLYNSSIRCPTNTGLIIYVIFFFVITLLSMKNAKKKAGIKLKHSIYGTLIFYLISSPAIFALTSSILGDQFANNDGCPTFKGVLLHALVYCMMLVGVMYLPEGN